MKGVSLCFHSVNPRVPGFLMAAYLGDGKEDPVYVDFGSLTEEDVKSGDLGRQLLARLGAHCGVSDFPLGICPPDRVASIVHFYVDACLELGITDLQILPLNDGFVIMGTYGDVQDGQ